MLDTPSMNRVYVLNELRFKLSCPIDDTKSMSSIFVDRCSSNRDDVTHPTMADRPSVMRTNRARVYRVVIFSNDSFETASNRGGNDRTIFHSAYDRTARHEHTVRLFIVCHLKENVVTRQ